MKKLLTLFTLKGRLDRTTYLWSMLGWTVVFQVFIERIFGKLYAVKPSPENSLFLLLSLVLIGVFYLIGKWIWISIIVRRLHDFELSGWWLFLMLVVKFGFQLLLPFFSSSWFKIEFLLFLIPGTDGKNRFDIVTASQTPALSKPAEKIMEKRIDFKL